jgi:hypothetical protein
LGKVVREEPDKFIITEEMAGLIMVVVVLAVLMVEEQMVEANMFTEVVEVVEVMAMDQ